MARQHNKIDVATTVIIFSLIILEVVLWHGIADSRILQASHIYFFNVAQGSSELIVFPGNIKVMVDAGGDAKIVDDLDSVLSSENDNYIDLAIISYPQANNYEGYKYILDHYRIGAFIYDGRNDTSYEKEWQDFLNVLKSKNIPIITLVGGDSIVYGKNIINILSPGRDLGRSADLADAALVEWVSARSFTALLASDIGGNVKDFLSENMTTLRADILKVPYPLLAGSSGQGFFAEVAPRVAIIDPGTKNTDTAPSKTMVAQLASTTTALIFQPTSVGTVEILGNSSGLQILKGK